MEAFLLSIRIRHLHVKEGVLHAKEGVGGYFQVTWYARLLSESCSFRDRLIVEGKSSCW